MNNVEEIVGRPVTGSAEAVTPISRAGCGEHRRGATAPNEQRQSRLVRFIEELRRRKVCRALTMYAVALWLVTQVVDLAYQELGLPDWTLRFVMVVGLVGLPIVLLLSWLLDLTPQGLVLESDPDHGRGPQPRPPGRERLDRRIDCCLLFVALVIAAGIVHATINPTSSVSVARYDRIAVMPFRVGPGEGVSALSESLAAELQYELASRARYRVIVPREPYDIPNCLTLTGSISGDEGYIRITAVLVDSESMEVVWSDVIQKDRTDALLTVADIARDVVALLRVPGEPAEPGGRHHGG